MCDAQRALVHGQNAGVVIGTSPISYLKVAAVVAGAIAALGLIGGLIWFFANR